MDCGQLHRMVADIAALGTRRGLAVVVRKGYAEALAVVVRKGCAEAECCTYFPFPDSRRHQRCLNWLLPSWDFSPQQVQVQGPVLSRARWHPCSTRRGPRLRTGRRGWTQVRQQRERKQLERGQLGRGLGRLALVQQRTRCR